jgi:Ran GTPase-activating protein (RanGAP) involved in mRNA processing and transport
MSEISPEYVDVFSGGLRANHALQVLTLNTNNIQSKGAIVILKALQETQIRELNLATNHLKDDVSSAFVKFLETSKTIRSLDLSGNNLTYRFTTAIAVPLSSTSELQGLNLSSNPLCGRGVAALGNAIAKCRALTFFSVVQCKIEAAGFTEFCRDLEKNATLTRLMLGRNPLRDEGVKALGPVITAHPSLKDLDLELCEISDEGAKYLFPPLSTAPAIERFSVKNNLIREGLMIQKAIADNQRILNFNVEYNDIDFKVLTEIHRLVRVNQKLWRDNQKQRIEEAVIKMAEADGQLKEVRTLITEERQTIAMLIDKLAATKGARIKAEEDKATHIANLEQKLSDVADSADRELTNQRDEQEQLRGQVGKLETEHAALVNKNDREVMNFQRECKGLKQVEKDIDSIKKAAAKGEVDWKNDLISAKMKYKDARQMFEAAYAKMKEDIRQAELAEAAAKVAAANAEKAAAAPPAKAKKKPAKKKGADVKPTAEGTSPEMAKPLESPKPSEEIKPSDSALSKGEVRTNSESSTSKPGSPIAPSASGDQTPRRASRTSNASKSEANPDSKPSTPSPDAPAPAQTAANIGKSGRVSAKPPGIPSARRPKKA